MTTTNTKTCTECGAPLDAQNQISTLEDRLEVLRQGFDMRAHAISAGVRALDTAEADIDTLRARCERLEAALRGLHEAAETLVAHASETYPHFEDTRGEKDIAATHEALEVASAALAGEGK